MSKSRSLGRFASAVGALLVMLLAGIAFFSRARSSDRDTQRLATAARRLPYRLTAGRLSPPLDEYKPYARSRGDRDVPTDDLGIRAAVAGIVSERPAEKPAASRSSGVARLLAGDSIGAAMDLELASRDARDANTYNDLAVAYLAKADEAGEFDSNVDALAATDSALRVDRNHAPARFNRALALERLGLLSEARSAWKRAAEIDTDSPWTIEARRAEQALESTARPEWRPEAIDAALSHADESALRNLATQWPREVRSWGESVYLASWAEHTERGEAIEALRQLESSAAIGRILATNYDEKLLVDSVGIIARASAEAKSTLACAYLQYRDGRIAHSRSLPSTAEDRFRDAQRLFARANSPMALVAQYYVGSAVKEQGHIHAAVAILDEVAHRAQAYPEYRALNAQIGWERGLCLAASGSLSKAIAVFEESRRAFHALGDSESRAALEQFLGETLESVGDLDQAWLIRRDALREFSRHESTQRKVVALTAAADLSIRSRRWRRADALLNLALESATALDSPELAAQCLTRRAIVHSLLDRHDEARKDLREAQQRRSLVTDEVHRERLRIDEIFATGIAHAKTDPATAGRAFDEVAAVLERKGAIQALAWVHLERARAARKLGHQDAAQASIVHCLSILEDRRRSLHDLEHRALLLASSQEAFDEAIAAAVESGRSMDVFNLAERSRARALLDRFERRETRNEDEAQPLTLHDLTRMLAREAALITYTALPDRLLIHIVRVDGLTTVEEPITREAIAQLSAQCAEILRNRPTSTIGPCVAAHRRLIAPILDPIRNAQHLAFVPDPSFAPLSLSSLEAVQSFGGSLQSVSEAPSATLVVSCARRAAELRHERSETVVVSGADFDRKAFPDLNVLRWVESEADTVAALHRRAIKLSGNEATAQRALAAFPKAGVIHFAGHAISPGRRIQQSQLVLASSPLGNTLDALAISALPLDSTHTVYLSACSTGRASGRADGVDNIALAFLVAGVSAIVATQWDIDDDAAPAAAKSFHALLAEGMEPISAARRAFRTVQAPPGMVVLGGSEHLIERNENR
jgi:CHAT domain-containing protein